MNEIKIKKSKFNLLMKERKLTVPGLAREIGISRSYCWKIFNGRDCGYAVIVGFMRAFPEYEVKDYFDGI